MYALMTRKATEQTTFSLYLSAAADHDMPAAHNAYVALQDARHGLLTDHEVVTYATQSVHAYGAVQA
jgi:hypothetical protein